MFNPIVLIGQDALRFIARMNLTKSNRNAQKTLCRARLFRGKS